jgi:hypothetical protein
MPIVRTRRRPAQELRATIDRLPLEVREAVLEGIKSRRIIAGAHVDGSGGLCPMAAADVRWKRVSKESVEKAREVAWAWDRYAEVNGSGRPATKRQLLALTSMLEASILAETTADEMPLSDVIAEHQLAKARHAAPADASIVAPASIPVPIPTPPAPRRAEQAPAVPAAPRTRVDTGERDRSSELGERAGWSWLRPFRSYDQYEEALMRALTELECHEVLMDATARTDQAVAR